MPFTPEAPKFLFENYTRNDKEWFREHKDIYEKEIMTPFGEIITALTPLMNEVDGKIICNPRKVSRIYRDVRIAKDGMYFRKSLWCSLMRPKKGRFDSKPEFFFWISPDDFGWGCGYYMVSSAVMQKIRELIIQRDETAMAAIKAYEGQKKMKLGGDFYKRDRYPDEPENLKQWLNRKNLYVIYESDSAEEYFSPELPKMVEKDLRKIAPVYRLFIKAEELLAESGGK